MLFRVLFVLTTETEHAKCPPGTVSTALFMGFLQNESMMNYNLCWQKAGLEG